MDPITRGRQVCLTPLDSSEEAAESRRRVSEAEMTARMVRRSQNASTEKWINYELPTLEEAKKLYTHHRRLAGYLHPAHIPMSAPADEGALTLWLIREAKLLLRRR